MRTNKWIPIALAINIGVLCFALYVAMTYLRQSDIVKSDIAIQVLFQDKGVRHDLLWRV